MIRNLVVVGIDVSSASLAAMEWAADYARMIDAELKAIHVRTTELPHRKPPHPAFTRPDDDTDLDIRGIFYSVRPEPGWSLTTLRGSTGEVLVKAARHAVVLVIGSRQMSGLEGVLNHSVSRYCALHAKIPVVICPDIDEIEAHAGNRRRGAAEGTSVPMSRIAPSQPSEGSGNGRRAAQPIVLGRR